MKAIITEIREITEGREVLESRIPPLFVFFIYLFILFWAVALIWSYFGEIDEYVAANGVVRSITTEATIKSGTSGKIEAVYYEEGKKVEKGDVLYSLVTPLQATEKELAGLSTLRRSIIDGQNYFNSLEERGQQNIYYYQYMEYRANMQTYTTRIMEKTSAYDRYNRLVSYGAIAQKDVEEAEYALHIAKYDLEKYQNEYLSTISTKIDQLSREHQDYVVRAPMEGIIHVIAEKRHGDLVQNGEEIATIIPETNEDYRLLLNVVDKDIAKIKVGSIVKCQFPALPYQEYGEIIGTVDKVSTDAAIDRKTGESIYTVEARIANKPVYSYKGKMAEIKLGMTCKANIVLDTKKIIYYVKEKFLFN